MQHVYKYPTGAEIPAGSTFLATTVETVETVESKIREDNSSVSVKKTANVLVWHYFLVVTA